MRWIGNKESDNVEDRRGGGGGKGVAMGGGIGGIVIVLIYLFMGGDPSQVMNQLQNSAPAQSSSAPRSAEEEKLASFTKVILGLTETVWDSIYQSKGDSYERPTLVMFSDQVQSEGCGAASSASRAPFIAQVIEKYI